uniref:Uncharacterized protein n=1 Tax=Cacopsylla melanoneura TaxID=428564 RepID=A0A8D8VJ57_9HEMI
MFPKSPTRSWNQVVAEVNFTGFNFCHTKVKSVVSRKCTFELKIFLIYKNELGSLLRVQSLRSHQHININHINRYFLLNWVGFYNFLLFLHFSFLHTVLFYSVRVIVSWVNLCLGDCFCKDLCLGDCF